MHRLLYIALMISVLLTASAGLMVLIAGCLYLPPLRGKQSKVVAVDRKSRKKSIRPWHQV